MYGNIKKVLLEQIGTLCHSETILNNDGWVKWIIRILCTMFFRFVPSFNSVETLLDILCLIN